MKYKNIAILGVDGSGKSTVINNVSKILGEACVVKYMGCRSFEIQELNDLYAQKHKNIFQIIKTILLQYYCFWVRYSSAKKTGKLVLFDRYIHEIILNSKGIMKIFNTILYRYLYPSPSNIIYLYCSAEESLRRKNDIENPKAFKEMKKRFDTYFLNNKDCYCLSSETYNSEELTQLVFQYIKKINNE